ncbi:MAG: hypothetical protein HYR77_11505 [Ignavibacteria bacterium]|nr:hypothetical protein [Ignavibacteria bacterium]
MKEFLSPLPRRFSQYQSIVLVEIFKQVMVLEHTKTSEALDIGDKSIRQRWKELVALGVSNVEKSLQVRADLLSQALFDSLMRASLKETEEKSQINRIAELIQTNHDDQLITHEVLTFYHQLYDGRYKLLLAFHRFMIDLTQKPDVLLRRLEKLRANDVIDNLKYLKKTLVVDEYHIISSGANFHVRNAIAHREIELREGKVFLKDGRWRKEYDSSSASNLVKTLDLTMLGLVTGLWVSAMKHNDTMRGHVRYKYHIEDIQKSLSSIVAEYKFVLIESCVKENDHLYCTLREMEPSAFEGPQKIESGKTVLHVQIVKAKPRLERIQDLIAGCELMFHGYTKITFEASDNKGEQVEVLEHIPDSQGDGNLP